MRIDLIFSQAQLDEMQLRDRNVVVIDVLRSSTTVVAALQNGAREIIPVGSIESAVKISGSLFGDVTLRGGERNGKIIQGFNLGNSPLEYSEATVRGKSIIFCTTNGSVAMAKSRYARTMVVGGFVNLSALVEFIRGLASDVLLLCAGRPPSAGGFSMEDSVCGGMIVQQLLQDKATTASDSALAAQSLYKAFGRSIPKMLRSTEHGAYLMDIGFEEDIKMCAAVDMMPVVPILSGTAIKLRRDSLNSTERDVTKSAV